MVKVEGYFVENNHKDNFKQKFFKAIFDLAAAEAEIVVEGIGKRQKFEFSQGLSMVYVQDFYLPNPSVNPIRAYPTHLNDPFYTQLRAQ